MLMRKLLCTAAAAALITACARQVETVSTGDVALDNSPPAAAGYTVRLAPAGGASVSGMASIVPGSFSDQTRIMLNLSNAEASSVHPWHVHYGTCGNDQGIVGPPSAYPSITSGLDGRAALTAILPFAITPGSEYMINVHKSPTEMGTIVACGNLATGGSASTP